LALLKAGANMDALDGNGRKVKQPRREPEIRVRLTCYKSGEETLWQNISNAVVKLIRITRALGNMATQEEC
jgi:hypothetical protein